MLTIPCEPGLTTEGITEVFDTDKSAKEKTDKNSKVTNTVQNIFALNVQMFFA